MPPDQPGPLLKPRRGARRWLQFSLRTLLGVTTVACICLAVAYYYVQPWLADRAAAKAIAEAGGSREMTPVGPDFLRSWFGPDVLQRISAVDLSQPETTAACLTILRRLKRLEKATLTGAKFTDAHLSQLVQLGNLRELTLRGTTVTAKRVAQARAERPDLAIAVGPLEVTFEGDLHFEEPKGKPFSRDHLTERIRCLDGSPVRIRGYMMPTFKQFGVTEFMLIYDNMEGFAPWYPKWEHVVVRTKPDKGVDWTVKPFTLEGTFSISELRDDTNQLWAVYRLTDAELRP